MVAPGEAVCSTTRERLLKVPPGGLNVGAETWPVMVWVRAPLLAELTVLWPR